MRKVTIEDISRETGLSRGTVSRALNNRPDISIATRQRVLDACSKLHYVPSHAARTLATGRNLTLAVFIDDLSSPLSSSILRGVLGTTGPRGYFVHIVEMNDRVPPEERIRQVPAERVDAAILITSLESAASDALRTSMESRPLGLTSSVHDLVGDLFEPDFREAGRVAGRFLTSKGAKRIGYVESAHAGIEERRGGLREVLSEKGVVVQAIEVGAALDEEDFGDFDALVLDDTSLLIAAARAIGRAATAPRLIGFGNCGLGSLHESFITVVDYSGVEIGRRLSHAILQRIEGDADPHPQHVRVAPHLLESNGR